MRILNWHVPGTREISKDQAIDQLLHNLDEVRGQLQSLESRSAQERNELIREQLTLRNERDDALKERDDLAQKVEALVAGVEKEGECVTLRLTVPQAEL